jgi:sugar phosphate permease
MPLVGIPLTTYVIYSAGWQKGYLVLAGFALVIAIPVIAVGLRSKPATTNDQEISSSVRDQTGRRSAAASAVLRTKRFWLLFASIIFATGAANAFLANMQPILLGGGLSVVAATSITTLVTISVIIGRLGTGALLDAFNKYVVTVTVLTISGLSAILLSQTAALPYAAVFVCAFLVMFSQGSDADAFPVILLKNYGREDFGFLFSLCYVASGIGGFGMPYALSYIRDVTGNYEGAAVFGGSIYLLGALLTAAFAFASRSSRKRQPEPARELASGLEV